MARVKSGRPHLQGASSDMKKIILASSNSGKIAEIQALLSDLSIELIPQKNFNIEDVDETGLTFVENALLKARNAAQISGLPALADDSGLTVDCLGGAPGVYSARYAGADTKGDSAALIAKLLSEISKSNSNNFRASFHCVMALLITPDDPAPIICHGIWTGEIILEPRGQHGFGYDPVFYVPEYGCTAAELDHAEKNKISHRAKAMSQFKEALHSMSEFRSYRN